MGTDEGRAIRFSIDDAELPLTIQAHDEQTFELLWETTLTAAGAIAVPGFFPRHVAVTVISPTARSTLFHDGREIEDFVFPTVGGRPAPGTLPNFHCPVCGQESGMVLGLTQAVCTNDDPADGCKVLFFNPSLADGGMSEATAVDLDGSSGGTS